MLRIDILSVALRTAQLAALVLQLKRSQSVKSLASIMVRPADQSAIFFGDLRARTGPAFRRFGVSFLWPQYLWLLLLAPVLVWLYVMLLKRKKRALTYTDVRLDKQAMGPGARGAWWERHDLMA